MLIDMSNYKMIYDDEVFNVISIAITIYGSEKSNTDKNNKKVKLIEALFLNESGEIRIIEDEAWKFQFVRRNNN